MDRSDPARAGAYKVQITLIFIEEVFVAKTTRFDQKDHTISRMRRTEKCDKSGLYEILSVFVEPQAARGGMLTVFCITSYNKIGTANQEDDRNGHGLHGCAGQKRRRESS